MEPAISSFGPQVGTQKFPADYVTIPATEYAHLKQAAEEHGLLLSVLFRNGLTQESLNTLLTQISDEENQPHEGFPPYRNGTFHQSHAPQFSSVSMTEEPSRSVSPERGSATTTPAEQRTIVLSNLPAKATLRDLTKIIRGGRILNIYQRSDQTAVVSFYEGAVDFLNHAQSKGISIHGKRIEAQWHERQFHPPAHVAQKINQGATRNLVIKGAANRLKVRQIREDLEHIHNLEVIEVRYNNDNIIICTNSVPNALFAKTCMMSRMPYRAFKIYWMPDDCAGPINHKANFAPCKSVPTLAKSSMLTKTNMFSLLAVDSAQSDMESDTESFEGVSLSDPGSWE